MQILEALLTAPARPFTTTEEADISCRPEFSDPYYWLEDYDLSTQLGDKLEAIGNNLYRITWMKDLHSEYGEVTVFGNLQQALDLFFNHK